jgi:signal transduction histidine kinase
MPRKDGKTSPPEIETLETLKALRDVLRVAAPASDNVPVLAKIAEHASRLTSSDGAYIETVDRGRSEIVAAALAGRGLPPAGTRGPYAGSVAEAAITKNQPILVQDASKESRSILALIKQSLSALVLPLVSDRGAIGVLILLRKTPSFSGNEIEALQVFADATTLVLQRSIMWAEAEEGRQSAEQALRSRDQVRRIVFHDLRNPVNTIHMALAALNRGTDPERTSTILAMIRRSSERISRLVQDLTDLAHLEQGRTLRIELQPRDIRDLSDEVCGIVTMIAQETSARTVCNTEGAAIVNVDRDRLLQAMYNVIDNAVKFTPRDGLVSVKTEVADREVRFVVSDTGPGISETDREHIFDAYWQSPVTAHLGSGLGLAITKQIVEQHGGRISVESALDKGSVFTIALPIYDRSESEKEDEP